MLIISKDKAKIKALKKYLTRKFKIKDLGPAKYFIGVKITWNRKEGTITLYQDIYISKILKWYSIENCHSVNTLIAARATEFIIPFNRQVMVKDTELYKSKIGFLIYLAI